MEDHKMINGEFLTIQEACVKHLPLAVKLTNEYASKTDVIYNYNEIYSAALFALYKAVREYKEERKVKFSTYCSACIRNEFIMMYNKEIKYRTFETSMNTPIASSNSEKIDDLSLENNIRDKQETYYEKIDDLENSKMILECILNDLEPVQTLVIIFKIAKMTQCEMAEKLGTIQPYISRVLKRSINKFKTKLQERKEDTIVKGNIAVSNRGFNEYKIEFLDTDEIYILAENPESYKKLVEKLLERKEYVNFRRK